MPFLLFCRVTYNADLWDLIQALSKMEKRYFRRYASIWGDNQDTTYLQLFDLLLAQKEYDSAAIHAVMNDPHFEKRYSANKNYLHGLICKAMRAFNAENVATNRIQGWLSDAAFLYQKTLFSQAQKVLKRAWKLASELELFPYMLEILKWERRILKRSREKNRADLLAETSQHARIVLNALTVELDFNDLYEQVYGINQEANEGIQSLDKLLTDHPLMVDKESATTFQSRHFYFQILIYRAQLHGDYAGALDWQEKQLTLWDSHPEMQREEPFRYASVMANYLTLATYQGEKEKYAIVREKMAALSIKSPLDQFQIDQQMHYLDLMHCLNHQDYLQSQQLIPAITRWLEKNRKNLNTSRLLAFWFNLAMLEFKGENYSAALYWVRELTGEGHQPERKDAQASIQVLLFILYFEVDEPELVESQYRAISRYLKLYYDQSYPIFLVPRLNRIFNLPKGKAQQDGFAELAARLQGHPNTKEWNTLLGFREISTWIQRRAI